VIAASSRTIVVSHGRTVTCSSVLVPAVEVEIEEPRTGGSPKELRGPLAATSIAVARLA